MQFDVSGHIFVLRLAQLVLATGKFRWLMTLLFISFVGLPVPGQAADSERKFDLSVHDSSETIRDVQVALEVNGQLKLNADGKQVSRLPMRVSGKSRYDERTLRSQANNGEKRHARFYRDAKATIVIGDNRLEAGLSRDRALIVCEADSTKLTLFSPLGPLTRDELELLQSPGNSAVLDRLAPGSPVALEAVWTHDAKDLALLLGLDAIHQSTVQSTLRQVEGDVAIIDMSGKVNGAIDGVSSDITLRAKYNIDLLSRRVTWLAMSIREDRAIGHATPGFDVTARVRIAISEKPTSADLDNSLLDRLPLDLNAASTRLRLDSTPGGFRLLHTRDWQVMVDRHDVTVLRMIDQGELIAQCNLSSLPDLPAGKRVQLPDFQADIEKALGSNFGQFVEASQQKRDRGHRVLRAVVSGLASEIPIQWIYYHISDDHGRQMALVFTMDAKLIEQFASADESIVRSFEFLARANPTVATATSEDTASNQGGRVSR